MEPATGLTILATAVGSAKLVEKLLGPTADYVGGGVKDWTERRVSNLGRVFRSATDRLGERIDEPGSVPPKVLKGILDAGSFCEDELTAQYLGGVLASSRSGITRDDRASTYIALLNRLSSYQIRAHYCFYHLMKAETKEYHEEDCSGAMSVSAFERFMDYDEEENREILFDHIMVGLLRESLIKPCVTRHVTEVWRIVAEDTAFPWFCVGSTVAGIELFLWAYGKGNLRYQDFTDPAVEFDLVSEIQFDFENCME